MELYYREEGRPSLPPLVIFHGLWGASENWLGVAALLSAHYHVIIPDLPNHGQSGRTLEYDYDYLANCLQEFIARQKFPQQPIIIGHSMGGKILMHMLLKWPERTAKAVIVDISPKDYRNVPASRLHARLLNYIQSTPIHETKERSVILKDIRAHFQEEELYQLLAKNVRRNKETGTCEWKVYPEALHANMEELLGWQEPTKTTSYLCPVLFVKGGNSDYIDTERDQSVIRQLFPAATMTEIPGAGHAIHAEQPERLASEIIRFLQE